MSRADGAVGWVTLVGFVYVWDKFAPETLSSAFGRAVKHRVGRPLVAITWAVTTAHLFEALSPRYDPFIVVFRPRKVLPCETSTTA